MGTETQTYNGASAGSMLGVPPHLIPDEAARYMQDILLNEVGLIRRRGPVSPVFGVYEFTDAASGIVQAVQPNGVHRIGVLHGTASPKLGVLSEDKATVTDLTWPGVLSSSVFHIVDAKPAIGGGTWIGTASQIAKDSDDQYLVYWKGADKADYSTGTFTTTAASKAVTGAGTLWTGMVVPGMFLFNATGVYVGVVASVESDTALTLEAPAPLAYAGTAYSVTSLRGFIPRVTKGYLTTDSTSTTVVGSDTKFRDWGFDTNWRLFRASDMAYIGAVASVETNSSLTLGANAAVTAELEHYVAIDLAADTTKNAGGTGKPGFLSAVYAERQFFALGTTLRFTEASDPEAIDLDPNAGDFIEVNSSAVGAQNADIAALIPAYNSLLVLKSNETFALAGTTPTQFELHKIHDDGVISSMSVQQYDGNVIYAGHDGIYMYDGVQSRSLVEDKLGDFYKSLTRSFNPATSRMWSIIDRDHYLLHIETCDSPYEVWKGAVGTEVTRMTICIYLPNRAVSFFTNVDIRGAIQLPATAARGVWYVVNTAAGARICKTSDLFETDGVDAITCTGNTAGPDFYLETKRYSLGDALRKKLWKMLLLSYYVGGGDLKFETLTGMSEHGTVSANNWLRTILTWNDATNLSPTWDGIAAMYDTWDDLGGPVYMDKRRRFTKRHRLFGFRIYQVAGDPITVVKLGPWSIGYKPLKPGRI